MKREKQFKSRSEKRGTARERETGDGEGRREEGKERLALRGEQQSIYF